MEVPLYLPTPSLYARVSRSQNSNIEVTHTDQFLRDITYLGWQTLKTPLSSNIYSLSNLRNKKQLGKNHDKQACSEVSKSESILISNWFLTVSEDIIGNLRNFRNQSGCWLGKSWGVWHSKLVVIYEKRSHRAQRNKLRGDVWFSLQKITGGLAFLAALLLVCTIICTLFYG